MKTFLRITIIGSLTTLTIALSGCGMATTSDTKGGGGPNGQNKLSGRVFGGQQPVVGATIQLYAVGITGPKSAATPLISSLVQSDGAGNFNISDAWNCTSNTAVYGVNPLLYIVASGGNPGLTSGTNNSALRLMAALGPCSGVVTSTGIQINEVTTAASVVALTPFLSDATHIGAQGANPTGLVNAFATANVLANMSTGLSPGASTASVTVPVNTIYALADILSACVNSSGPGTANCDALFSAATTPSGTPPVDTVTAMLNINSYPANHVAALLHVIQPAAPFITTIATPPNDWTVALKFTGGGLAAPTGLALDAGGNAWVANAGGNSITGLSSTGAQLTGTTGYTANQAIYGAQAIAVDKTGNVWVADTLLNSVFQLTVSGGAVQSSAKYTGNGIAGPTGIAIDSQNNVWLANFTGASVTELNSLGQPVGASPLTAGATLKAPAAVAIDAAGNVWVTDNGAADVVEFNTHQALLSGAGYTDNFILAPEGVAIDPSGRAWIADFGANAVSPFSNSGTPLATTPLAGGGLSMPLAIAIDGQGTVWVANGQTGGSISELAYGQSAPLSPPSGLGSLNLPLGIAIDASGSVWTANTGDSTVSKIVGIAAPAPMPLAVVAGP